MWKPQGRSVKLSETSGEVSEIIPKFNLCEMPINWRSRCYVRQHIVIMHAFGWSSLRLCPTTSSKSSPTIYDYTSAIGKLVFPNQEKKKKTRQMHIFMDNSILKSWDEFLSNFNICLSYLWLNLMFP